MKKVLIALFVLALAVSGATKAQAISIPVGPITFHWTNWETRVDAEDDTLDGIFRLDQILQGVNVIWSAGAGEELTGTFQNLTVDNFDGEGLGDIIGFTGGDLQVYLDTTPDFDPTSPGSGVTDGDLWLDMDFVTGGDFFNPTNTLTSIVTGAGVDPDAVLSIKGTGSGLLEVVGGSAAGIFDTNTYARLDGSGLFADMSLSANFFIRYTGTDPFDVTGNRKDGWDVWSSDPIGANAVPEPTSMLLFGMGMAGLVAKKLAKKRA